MNNKYRQELQSSINQTEDQLEGMENALTATSESAKVSLYYSRANVERNRFNQMDVTKQADNARRLKNRVGSSVNLATTTLAAAKNSLEESKKAINNMGTAATNMQMAANAITALASNTASVMAVASAANYDSDLYQAVQKATEKVQMAAKCAEKVSVRSLEATIDASQSAAQDVFSDAKALLGTLTELQENTVTDYTTEAEKVVEATAQTTNAIKAQNQAMENFEISGFRLSAVMNTRNRLNQVSNHDLQLYDPALSDSGCACGCDTEPGRSFSIRFRRFFDENNIKNYRIILVPEDEAPGFDITTAKTLAKGNYAEMEPSYKDAILSAGCGENGISDCTEIVEYGLNPDSGAGMLYLSHYELTFVQTLNGDQKECSTIKQFWKDFAGNDLACGQPYVAFIFLDYTQEYQNVSNNTLGYLSLPSAPLTLKYRLPRIDLTQNALKIHNPYKLQDLEVAFNARDIKASEYGLPIENAEERSIVEYRAVFVSEGNLYQAKEQSSDNEAERRAQQNNWLEAAAGLDTLYTIIQANDADAFESELNNYIHNNCTLRGFLLHPEFNGLLAAMRDESEPKIKILKPQVIELISLKLHQLLQALSKGRFKPLETIALEAVEQTGDDGETTSEPSLGPVKDKIEQLLKLLRGWQLLRGTDTDSKAELQSKLEALEANNKAVKKAMKADNADVRTVLINYLKENLSEEHAALFILSNELEALKAQTKLTPSAINKFEKLVGNKPEYLKLLSMGRADAVSSLRNELLEVLDDASKEVLETFVLTGHTADIDQLTESGGIEEVYNLLREIDPANEGIADRGEQVVVETLEGYLRSALSQFITVGASVRGSGYTTLAGKAVLYTLYKALENLSSEQSVPALIEAFQMPDFQLLDDLETGVNLQQTVEGLKEKGATAARKLLLSAHLSESAENKSNGKKKKVLTNKSAFPFDMQTISLMTLNDYAVASKNSTLPDATIPTDNYEWASLSKYVSELSSIIKADTVMGEQFETLQQEVAQEERSLKGAERSVYWHLKKHHLGRWSEFVKTKLAEEQIQKGVFLMLQYALSERENAGLGLYSADGVEYVARPGTTASDNYGIPLFENQISEDTYRTCFAMLDDCILKDIIAGPTYKEYLDEQIDSSGTQSTLNSQNALNYRVLMVTAYAGPDAYRNQFLDNHSDYSQARVTIYD